MRRFDVSTHAYAHRGLWGGNIPENSLAAFHASAAAAVGCELDVRPTRDGELVVFHDATLQRLCGDARRLDAVTLDELSAIRLPDGSAIPTLRDCLAAMAGQPVLIEIKVDEPGSDLADHVAEQIARIDAPLATMSFDATSVARLRELISDRPIGLLIDGKDASAVPAALEKARSIGVDYIAPHHSILPAVAAAGARLPLVTWTVRTEADLRLAWKHSAAPIFEGLGPGLAMPSRMPI